LVGIAFTVLATQNECALKNLALFAYKAFSRWKTLLVKNVHVHYEPIIIQEHYSNIILYTSFHFHPVHCNIETFQRQQIDYCVCIVL